MAPKTKKRGDKEEASSGSDALVSDSEDEDEDYDTPQLPAPDDGEGSDFDELQARRSDALTARPSSHAPAGGV